MRTLAALLGLAALAVPTLAEAATRTAIGRARTLRPLTITPSRDLDFGRIVVGATAGRVAINANTDARTRTGGPTLIGGGTPGAARFAVTGTPSALAQITLGARPTLVRAGGTETMALAALTLNGARNRRFTTAGTMDVRVGGTLIVGVNQVAGSYAGTFAVTVLYQ
jgi:Mat/Ecp fimbriae major subunit